ncbi:MAG: hypothetical protein K2O54_01520, partial [Prevotella sp.]|nr:hypothetical protein [Prevotella sp.]
VTGEELNNLVVELQSCFAEINERDRKLTKEFGQVYETFEALDKGYIQGILIGVKSAEKASQEAKEAQKDIDDTIEALQKTITKLKEFKDEVNKNMHLDDIDQMWSDILQINSFIVKLKELEHISDIDTVWEYSHSIGANTENLSNKLSEAEAEIKRCKESLVLHENEKTHMKQRINIAYIVAGSAMAISIIQMCLLFVGVL